MNSTDLKSTCVFLKIMTESLSAQFQPIGWSLETATIKYEGVVVRH